MNQAQLSTKLLVKSIGCIIPSNAIVRINKFEQMEHLVKMSMESLLTIARQGNAEAQKELGDRYLEGNDCERNENEAYRWYREAAKQGLASAQMAVGDCLIDGWGTEENSPLALKYYLKAAKQGYSEAQNEVGDYYLWGEEGVDQDGAEALQWHRTAADGGNARAIKTLGDYYWSGYQVQMDKTVARILFKHAANLGWPEAGMAYPGGEGYMAPFVDFLGLA